MAGRRSDRPPPQPAAYQRCYVHFLRNALDYVPRKSLPSRKRGSTTIACRSCAGWEPVLGPAKPDPGDRRDLIEARRDLAAWLAKWSAKYSKLTGWVEDNIDETLTFYRLPRQHHKHLKSTNMLERPNEEIKRRTHVRADLPQWRELPQAGAGSGGRDPRELARAASLPQHGRSARAQKGGAALGGLTPDPFSIAPCSPCRGRCAPASPVPPHSRRHP